MNRRSSVKAMASLAIISPMLSLKDLEKIAGSKVSSDLMPLMFIGHGNPMNALWDNDFTQHLQQIGKSIDKPKAILVVSAHWLTKGTHVSINPNPETIHDFGGFPQALFDVQYPAKGAPDIAKEVAKNVTYTKIHEVDEWGLDHGAWTVLKFIYPEADVPVFQLSIDITKGPEYHYQLAKQLAFLRKRGVLIMGSGNIVHNLRRVDFHNIQAPVYDWAAEFDTLVKEKILSGDHQPLLDYQKQGTSAQISVPTNDHYLPMLYILGLADKKEEIKFTYEGFQNASISMRSFRVG